MSIRYSDFVLRIIQKSYLQSLLVYFPVLLVIVIIVINYTLYTDVTLISKHASETIQKSIETDNEFLATSELKLLVEQMGVVSASIESHTFNLKDSRMSNVNATDIPLFPFVRFYKNVHSYYSANSDSPKFSIVLYIDTFESGLRPFFYLLFVAAGMQLFSFFAMIKLGLKRDSLELTAPIDMIALHITQPNNHSSLTERLPSQFLEIEDIRNLASKIDAAESRALELGELVQKTISESQSEKQSLKQIIHDIKGPLGSLNIAIDKIENLDVKNLVLLISNKIKSTLNAATQIASNQTTRISEDIILGILKEFESEIKMRHPEIKVFLPKIENRISIRATSDIFSRSTANLIYNSVESFSGKNGIIKVDIRHDLSNMHIFITDDGPGIASNLTKHITARPVKSTKASGQGIGLYGTRKLLETVGGNLQLVETGNHGTSFRISFVRVDLV